MNGSEFNPSSSSNHRAVSGISGSRSTPCATRRMRTRSPSKRNSRGSRTAWLRPFWNNLATSVFAIMQSLVKYILTVYITPAMSIPQRLPRLQRVLNALLRLLLPAQRFERLALQIQQILFAHRRARRHVAAAKNLRDLGPQFHFILGDVVALAHQMDPHFERRQSVLSRRGDVAPRLRRLIPAAYHFERPRFRVV